MPTDADDPIGAVERALESASRQMTFGALRRDEIAAARAALPALRSMREENERLRDECARLEESRAYWQRSSDSFRERLEDDGDEEKLRIERQAARALLEGRG